ncbi:MAG: thioredoxin [Gammaproteobacteria bacterium]
MSESPYIFTITEENFAEVVLEGSMKVPVLVDFWAAWCGPCQSLMPVLAKLADEYQGQFLLAKINSDEQQALAAQFGVRSLPTVKVFRNGQPVDEFMGAQPESAVREVIERHIVRESDLVHAEAVKLFNAGDLKGAVEKMRSAHEMDPGNKRIVIDLAKLYAEDGQRETAMQLLEKLPLDARISDEVKSLEAKLRFANAAGGDRAALSASVEQNPDDLEARQQLAASYISSGEYEAGMEQLLEIMKRDRSFGDDAGRKGLLDVFEMLGADNPLTQQYRRKLSSLLL